METESYTNNSHLGRKIERIRRLRGMTQTDLGELLGVTKQAISKMEQSEKIDDDKLKQVADALGVTEDGLKKFIPREGNVRLLCVTEKQYSDMKLLVGSQSVAEAAIGTERMIIL